MKHFYEYLLTLQLTLKPLLSLFGCLNVKFAKMAAHFKTYATSACHIINKCDPKRMNRKEECVEVLVSCE